MKIKKSWVIIGCIIAVILIGTLGLMYRINTSSSTSAIADNQKNIQPEEKGKTQDDILTPGVSIKYSVKPLKAEDKILSVNIRILSADSLTGQKFSLDGSMVKTMDSKCIDQTGLTVPTEEKEGIISIGPVDKDVKSIDFSYGVRLGEVYDGKVKGDLYKDLLVFSGETVLLFPYFDAASKEDMSAMDKYLSSVSIQVEGEEGWSAVMPYQQTFNTEQISPVVIENPDWNVFFNLAKSCYAFGKFESLPIQTKNGYTVFLVDSAYSNKLTAENVDAMERLYNYYAGIFGEDLNNYAVILLRRELSKDAVILGGVGGKTLGLSMGMDTGDDWYTFSHSLYHSFFDSKILAKNLHYAPNLWIYEGLADYYVDRSAVVLSDSIRRKCGIESNDDIQSVYTRYLYFALTDPALLKLSPASETRNLMARDVFYFGTKVPLIIDAIEKVGEKKNGVENNIIRSLMRHAMDKELEMGSFMVELLGDDEKNIRDYFSGEKIIPFAEKPDNEDPKKIIQKLNEYESMMTGLYQADVPGYPYDPVEMLKPEQILKEAQARKLTFNSKEIQKEVKNYSDTVYLLLMQNALRADICGEKDLFAPEFRLKLNKPENIKKWREFADKVGYYDEK